MLRESNAAGARHVMVAIPTGATGSYRYGSRATTNAVASETTATGPGSTFTAPDTWMILQRKGDTVTIATSISSAGPFNTLGAVTLANLGATLQAGVFSSSGRVGVNARALMSGFEMIKLDVDTGISSRWKLESNLLATPTTYNGTAVGIISYVTGKLGSNALSLNGNSANYVNTPYVLNPQSGNFTATAWVKLVSAISGRAYFILHQNTLSGTGRGWLYRNGAGKIACILGNAELASASTLPADGNWYHVAVVKNGTTGNNIQLYINGVADGSPGARTVESCLGAIGSARTEARPPRTATKTVRSTTSGFTTARCCHRKSKPSPNGRSDPTGSVLIRKQAPAGLIAVWRSLICRARESFPWKLTLQRPACSGRKVRDARRLPLRARRFLRTQSERVR